MKNKLIIASLIAVSFTMGCTKTAETTSAQNDHAAIKQMDKVQAATKDASQQLKAYAYEQKTEFVTAMKSQLADLNRSLEELSVRLERSSERVRNEGQPKLAALRNQSTQLGKQLDAVVTSTPSTWTVIKADSEKAYASLKEGLDKSRQWASDKIAP